MDKLTLNEEMTDTLGINWVEEFDSVLWAIRKTPIKAIGETNFDLVYDTDVVVATGIDVASHQVKYFEAATNVD